MGREKVLITVKTYPTLSRKHGELVCMAGVREDGSWVATVATDWPRGGNAGKPGQSVFSKIESTKLKSIKNMEARIYKPKRLRNGKRTIGRLYRARVKLTGDNKVRDISLGVSDKQVAQQKLNKMIQELDHESAGLIPAKPERETAKSPLLDLVSEYVNELTILGRSAGHLRHVRTRLHLLVRECRWTRLADVTPASFQSWRKEPLFHRSEFGTTGRGFEKMTAAEFWEVSASAGNSS